MLLNLIASDFKRLYKNKNIYKCIFSSFVNPSFHAVVLIRCAQCSPRIIFWFFRLLLISKHSIDFGYGCKIGGGLLLPHPIGIVFGGGAEIGRGALIYQNVTLGKHKGGYPVIEENCTIYGNSIVVGNIKVGRNCTIAALQFLSKDLSENAVYRKK